LKPFFVHLLRCAGCSCYVEHADDIVVRTQHHGDAPNRRTLARVPVELLQMGGGRPMGEAS